MATMVDDPAIQSAPLMASLLQNDILLIGKTYTKSGVLNTGAHKGRVKKRGANQPPASFEL
jgi:hypothetical protein